jgi:S1-C subfamily serine protease
MGRRKRKSLNLRWDRVFGAAVLCLGFVGLFGFGLGYTVADDSGEIYALRAELGAVQTRLRELERGAEPYAVFGGPISLGVEETSFLGVGGTTAPNGVELTRVVKNTGAMRAHLQVGDVITRFDGERTTNFKALKASIRAREIGETVELTVERDGAALVILATLGERP